MIAFLCDNVSFATDFVKPDSGGKRRAYRESGAGARALQNLSGFRRLSCARSVMECGTPVPLWPQTAVLKTGQEFCLTLSPSKAHVWACALVRRDFNFCISNGEFSIQYMHAPRALAGISPDSRLPIGGGCFRPGMGAAA